MAFPKPLSLYNSHSLVTQICILPVEGNFLYHHCKGGWEGSRDTHAHCRISRGLVCMLYYIVKVQVSNSQLQVGENEQKLSIF